MWSASAGRTARRVAVPVLLALATPVLSAHVGSSDTWFEGRAGGYPVRVSVRTPGVVPGLADVTVRVLGGGATAVAVRPFRWDVGPDGAPPADPAAPVSGDPELWAAQLWFMAFGSYSVEVAVDGPAGGGTVLVPVMAVATRTLGMDPGLTALLTLLGLLLAAGVVSIARAAAREAVLPPGDAPDRRRVWRGRFAMGGAGLVVALLLLGGQGWWRAVDAAYTRNLYRPYTPHVAIATDDAGRARLDVRLNDSTFGGGRRFSPLMPDHGKLMHLFLVRDSTLEVFAHLHPVALDSASFATPLPPLPAGRYRVYADVVHESGFAQTLPGAVTVSAPLAGALLDPDDGWVHERAPAAPGAAYRWADGTTLRWAGDPSPAAGAETSLRFELADADGAPLGPEPYLGMAGHLILMRDDGEVFVHLHPSGTASMAAQLRLALRQRGDTSRAAYLAAMEAAMGGDAHAHHPDHAEADAATLSFPYAFPAPGRYAVWVQLRRRGEVRTATWAVTVGRDQGATARSNRP